MQDSRQNLSAYCTELVKAAGDASAWARENEEIIRNEQEGLQAELRRSARLFRQCARAADRKMCAGVFGPSQAGKSYLISALARDHTGGLMALFGGEKRDFISEINPEGGKESTGLVTRFTMTRPASLPEGFPVQVRLLTETDLVKTIANTYYADCEHKEVARPEDISAALDALQSRKGQGSPHIDLDAMEDLREYLVKHFQTKPRPQELERSYWKRALELGPALGLGDRIRLYSLIWDDVPQLTQLLEKLLRALEKLGYAGEAYCPLDALIPRDGSIIDVAMLAGLDDDANGPELQIRTAQGQPILLPRAIVTALTAELTIVMDQKPDDYFDHTDLLDFPGYRSRYKFTDVRRELEKPGMAKELFLRGKVAYLFQRYCAEKELTSMLLCIGPSNQEVQDLPGVIDDWLLSTHGKLPETRQNKPVALYFVLTKFDMEFEQKKGAPSVESRWDNRLHASLLDFFGKQHDWPRIWDGTRAFNNLFLLRNPNFRFDAILEYDSEGREKSIRADQQSYVTALENAFMASPLVATHFSNPRVAWDAAMRFNDGGISHIRDCLRPLCNPEIKREQIRTMLNEQQTRLLLRLKAFYRSDDKEEERREKEKLALELLKIFSRLLQTQRMGEFIRMLTVRDHDLYDLRFEARRRFLASEEDGGNEAPPVSIGCTAQADDVLAELFGDPVIASPEPEAPCAAEPKPRFHKDEAQYFADMIEGHWCSCLRQLSDDTAIQNYYDFPAKEFSRLVSELTLGAARLGLVQHMETAMREASAFSNMSKDRIVWQQVGMATTILNAYVSWLGRNPRSCTKEQRTVFMRGENHTLFTPPDPVNGFPSLPELQEPFEKKWCMDWLRALYALMLDNVDFDGMQSFNREQNARLGAILQCIDPRQGAEAK